MDAQTVFNLILRILIGTDLNAPLGLPLRALTLFGLWGIFRKANLKGWKALLPCVREAQLGVAAGREPEGRIVAMLRGGAIICDVVDVLVTLLYYRRNGIERDITVFDVVTVVINLALIIYQIRIYLGLIEVYGRKKAWVLLWVVADWIPAPLWGWLKKYQPQWTTAEMKTDASTFFSSSRAAVLDQGLTVNLEERTATELFQKKYLLRDIHMYIKPGRMVLLLGGSGAGKTTFLNAVNGYEPARAEVVLNGRNMYRNYKEMQYEIGFVPQQDLMRGSDTVYRTLADAASLRLPVGFTMAQRAERVEEIMRIFGLTPVKNSLVSKLSGGQRKRLSIAMEFISNPALFILDEPDSGLDGVMARELFQQLRQIADQGKIIIVITHTPDRVIDLFDDVIVLAKDANRTGRLAWFGPIADARAFFGKEKMEEIVRAVNRQEEGGEGRADEFIMKYAEVQHV